MLHLILALQVNLLLAAVAAVLRLPSIWGVAACVPIGLAFMHYAGTEGYAPFAACATIGVFVGLVERPTRSFATANAAGHVAPGLATAGGLAQIDLPARHAKAAHSAFSAGNVIASFLPPVALAAFWDFLPDPDPCHAAVIAGIAAVAGNAASAACVQPRRIKPTFGGGVTAVAAGSLVALAACAGGGMLFAHVWVVMTAMAGASLCFSLIASASRRNTGVVVWLANVVSSGIACTAAGGLAWAAR